MNAQAYLLLPEEDGRKTKPGEVYGANLMFEEKTWSIILEFIDPPCLGEWVEVSVSTISPELSLEQFAGMELEILEGPRKVGLLKFQENS